VRSCSRTSSSISRIISAMEPCGYSRASSRHPASLRSNSSLVGVMSISVRSPESGKVQFPHSLSPVQRELANGSAETFLLQRTGYMQAHAALRAGTRYRPRTN
jgi:hypothetical protein